MKTEELYPVALYFVKQFVKGSNKQRILRHFNGYETLEDVAMDVVVKVLKAKPEYLTKAYVKIAATHLCINKLNKKLVPWVEITKLFDENSQEVKLEELVEGDSLTALVTLEDDLMDYLSEEERETYDHLLTMKYYPEISEELNICTRTFERRVHDLKYKIIYILTEEEPDLSKY